MFTNLRLSVIAVTTALLIPAMSGLSTAAYADDEYGVSTVHGALIRQSAESAPPCSHFAAHALGRCHDMTVASNAAQSASDVPAGGKLGTGGKQDQLAREVYQPGTGTDW